MATGQKGKDKRDRHCILTSAEGNIFAVSVGFSVLDNHLHLLVRLDPEVANSLRFDPIVNEPDIIYRISRVSFCGFA